MKSTSPNTHSAPPPTPRWLLPILGLALLAAVLFPRALALGGLEMTASLTFEDMPHHLQNMAALSGQLQPVADGGPAHHSPDGAALPGTPAQWPHGVYRVGALWSRVFGPLSIWTTQLTNLCFTLLLLGGVLALGRLMVDTEHGLWAALLTALTPPLLASSWYFSLDYPLVAMVTVGLVLLLLSRGMSNLESVAALAIWSALGLWVKGSYFLFLAPAVAAVLASEATRRKLDRRRLVLLAMAVLLGGALTGILQGNALADIPRILRWQSALVSFTPDGGQAATGAGALFAPGVILQLLWLQHPWLLLLALPGLALACHPRLVTPWRAPLLGALFGGGLLLALLDPRMARYTLPLFPLLALLCTWGLTRLLPPSWRRVALTVVILLHASTTIRTHKDPEPPYESDAQKAQLAWLLDQPMPGALPLAGLRRHIYHPDQDLRPLATELSLVLNLPDVQDKVTLALCLSDDTRPPSFSDNVWPRYLSLLARQQAGDVQMAQAPCPKDPSAWEDAIGHARQQGGRLLALGKPPDLTASSPEITPVRNRTVRMAGQNGEPALFRVILY